MKRIHNQPIWIGRFLASDPGRKRFQSAGKTTISIITSVFIMMLLLTLFNYGTVTPAIVAGMVGLLSIMLVMDDTLAKKKVTTFLIGLSAALGITLGSLSAAHPFFLNVLMVLIIFSAFYFSKYQIRYFSMGMTGFMTTYFSSILRLDAAHLSWFYIGVVCGVLFSFLYNFVIFKGSAHELRRGMRSFHIQTNLVLTLLIQMIEEPDNKDKDKKLLDKNVQRLNEYSRMVAADINDEDLMKLWPGITASQLRLYIFDAEMLVQTLKSSVEKLRNLDAFEQNHIKELVVWIIRSLRDTKVLSQSYSSHALQDAESAVQELRLLLAEVLNSEEEPPKWVYPLRRIESIANHVVDAAVTIQESLTSDELIHDNKEKNDEPLEEDIDNKDKKDEETKTLKPSTRKAIQSVVAGILAIITGHIISPVQPYWVLLTTFIIQIGTESVGRTYVKGFQRSFGTVLGAIAGFIAAKLVTGNVILEVFLLFLVIFLTFYVFTVSYTWMSFFITMLIAFMYDLLLGGISVELISARVIDTIAGALIALLVSAYILPKKTTDKVTESFDDFLEELKEYTSDYLQSFLTKEPKELTDQAFDIDQKLQVIKDEAQSLLQRPDSMRKSGISRWMLVVTAINYYAKHLLASSHRKPTTGALPAELQDVIKKTEGKLRKNIDLLQDLIKEKENDSLFWSLDEERDLIETLSPSRQRGKIDLIHHMYYIWRINQSIAALGKELGAGERK
ncbi:FUSC family protein [Rossellomorea vietnamensis]|uniref:FUSC family protein n=1 Tax=Rossellomorea vietnamensis TaxID=218284 RepID=A0A5D4MDZ9_9BACI|nr:FUSC family protein [Rossellomorea vietnamensis]TYR99255.1 FUSC family protein [Rossellomorea vietnamensis]